MQPRDRKDKNVYTAWLKRQPWTFFCSGTTRYYLTLNSARRLAERFYDAIKNQSDRVVLFWAAEPFDTKEGHHIHFLVHIAGIPSNELFDTLVNLWQWVTGNKALFIYAGTNRVEWEKTTWNAINLRSYDNKRGGSGYTAKYINKTRADYDYLCNQDEPLMSTCNKTEQDYCPVSELKRYNRVYHIGRALQECNSVQGRQTDARR
jgi:hypothetical protein